ncbi:MAG: riboflavin biosynthesis protein RibD [Rhodospirillaceae bacterium]|nr:riboflavin biosynthesis protein RibD [Rhodospirillaceae bacterium]
MSDDSKYMKIALRLGQRGLGRTWPNPSVGCVIVRSDTDKKIIIGRGTTQSGGFPHAENQAINQAISVYGKDSLIGSTAYVSLEPCCHYGKTPPCVNLLIESGLRRVVIGCVDPDPRMSGMGIELLKKSGVEVVSGILEQESESLNAGFFNKVRSGRPLVTLKMATTVDGKIATKTGESKWITGALAREKVHIMRSQYDAIAIGINTVLQDNPKLTCRLPGLENRSPVRVVFDSSLKIDFNSDILKTASSYKTWIITSKNHDLSVINKFEEYGVEIISVALDGEGHIDLYLALAALAKRGITRLMVEGGATLSTSFLRSNLVDLLAWFRAPSLIGADGKSVFSNLGVDGIDSMHKFELLNHENIGSETLDLYGRIGLIN